MKAVVTLWCLVPYIALALWTVPETGPDLEASIAIGGAFVFTIGPAVAVTCLALSDRRVVAYVGALLPFALVPAIGLAAYHSDRGENMAGLYLLAAGPISIGIVIIGGIAESRISRHASNASPPFPSDTFVP